MIVACEETAFFRFLSCLSESTPRLLVRVLIVYPVAFSLSVRSTTRRRQQLFQMDASLSVLATDRRSTEAEKALLANTNHSIDYYFTYLTQSPPRLLYFSLYGSSFYFPPTTNQHSIGRKPTHHPLNSQQLCKYIQTQEPAAL